MNKYINKLAILPIILIALVPLLAVAAPRAMAFIPAVIAILGMTSIFVIQKERIKICKGTPLFIAPVIILGAISLIWSLNPDTSFERISKLACIMIGGAALTTWSKNLAPRDADRLMIYTTFLISIGATIILIDQALKYPLYRYLHDLGPEGSINSVYNRATVALVLSSFAAITILKLKKIQKGLIALLAAPLLALMIFSDSQSAQMALIVGTIAYIAFPYHKSWAWYVLCGLISATILGAPALAQYMFQHVETINKAPFFGGSMGYGGPRLEIWNFISEFIKQTPIYGAGIEVTRTIDDFTTEARYYGSQAVLHPHNFALQLWIEFGLIGALFGSGFLTALILRIKYSLPMDMQRSALSTLIATLSVAATGYGMWQSWWVGLLFYVSMLIISTNISKTAAEIDRQKSLENTDQSKQAKDA